MNDDFDIIVLQEKCTSGQINWSTHALARLQERNIEPTDVINCISNGKIIERYLGAYPHPACLKLDPKLDNTLIHVVAGYDVSAIWIITAYKPDDNDWSNEHTKRKE